MTQLLSSPFFNIVINIFGGLAIFMFAMEMLGDHLQNIVGDKIEKVLRKLTSNPSSGMVVGALVTFLTQSSSITVLTLIGLVNVGVLNLSQGMGVLLGAEIGTTLTAQLVTLDIGKMYYPLVIIGLVLAKFGKEKTKSLGKVIFSFGLLFLGMELMKTGAKPIGNNPMVLSLFENFSRNPILGVIAGAIFTAVTSSSSATTSLVVALGISNVIGLPAGIALIMGANIGTTFLEMIAVFGLSLTAKRIAVAQAVINIIGVLIMLPFIKPFAGLMALSSQGLGSQIANSHTVFNIGSSMIFLVFVKLIVKLVVKILPGEVVTVERGAKYIDDSLIKMPHLALVNAEKEVERFSQIVDKSFFHISQYFSSRDDNLLSTVATQEDFVDKLHLQTNEYLIKVSEHEFNKQSSEKLAKLMHGLTDLERTHDHLSKAAEYTKKAHRSRIKFTDKELQLVGEFSNHCYSFYRKALQAFFAGNIVQSKKLGKEMTKLSMVKEDILKKVGKSDQAKIDLLQKIVHNLERAAHHGENLTDIVVSGF